MRPTDQERIYAISQAPWDDGCVGAFLARRMVEYDPLTKYAAGLEIVHGPSSTLAVIEGLQDYAARLEADKAELVDVLRKRNTHEHYCPAITPPGYELCTCGLLETLELIAKHGAL